MCKSEGSACNVGKYVGGAATVFLLSIDPVLSHLEVCDVGSAIYHDKDDSEMAGSAKPDPSGSCMSITTDRVECVTNVCWCCEGSDLADAVKSLSDDFCVPDSS